MELAEIVSKDIVIKVHKEDKWALAAVNSHIFSVLKIRGWISYEDLESNTPLGMRRHTVAEWKEVFHDDIYGWDSTEGMYFVEEGDYAMLILPKPKLLFKRVKEVQDEKQN